MAVGNYVKESVHEILKVSTVEDINSEFDIISDDQKKRVFDVVESVRDFDASLQALEKPSQDFFARDFIEIMIERMREINKKFPEITKFLNEDVLTLLMELNSAQDDKFYFFADKVFSNMILDTIDDIEFIFHKVREYQYPLTSRAAAICTLIFELQSPLANDVTIEEGTQVSTPNGEFIFEFLDDVVIDAGTISGVGEAKNSIANNLSFTGDVNVEFQRFLLDEGPVIIDSVNVTVNGLPWNRYRSVLSIPSGENGYAIEMTQAELAHIVFGDNESGRIPDGSIEVDWESGGGAQANFIQVGAITEIIGTIEDSLGDPITAGFITVINRTSPEGGVSSEGLETLKKNISNWVAATERSIIRQDFINNVESVSGVIRAFAVDVPYLKEKELLINIDENEVFLYVLTETGDLTEEIEDRILQMFDERPTFGSVEIIINPVVFQDWSISGRIYFEEGANAPDMMSNIKNDLLEYFSFTNKDASGNYIVDWGSERIEIPESEIVGIIEIQRGGGIIKVEIDEPADTLLLDPLAMPRLTSVDNLIPVNRFGVEL